MSFIDAEEALLKENNHLKYKVGDKTVDLKVIVNKVYDACIEKVFELIDEKIKEVDVRDCTCSNCVTEQLLNELKKELLE